MIITEYWPIGVFRPGLLSNLISLGKIVHFMAEVTTTSNPMARHRICQAAMDTPFNENSRS